MASELEWVPHFCLTCDKQTDGTTYCSESCRLADYEETPTFYTAGTDVYASYAAPSSPSWAASNSSASYLWSSTRRSPTYPQPYSQYSSQYTAPRRSASTTSASTFYPTTASASSGTATTSVTYHHVLSPSSSHSSLSSMRSNLSAGAVGALSAFAGTAATHSGLGTSAGSTGGDLSDKARSELRKYASSLEQGKLQRRRSC